MDGETERVIKGKEVVWKNRQFNGDVMFVKDNYAEILDFEDKGYPCERARRSE